MEFSLKDILEATNAKVLKSEGVGVNDKFTFSTDTRTIKKGQIYLPLKGENFDGEKFIDKALEAGALGYFITEVKSEASLRGANEISDEAIQENNLAAAELVLQVENTLTAYLELARFCVRKIAPKTVAITGSSGKTTTKEMAYCVASQKFKTHKSELNFNNEIGLCKTVLSMPDDTQVLILEMGMRGLGEIELLSKYSEPDISIIANVGTAHIGRLGSRENIAKAKCEVVKYMKEGGVLIAHNDRLIKDANPLTLQPSNPPIYFSLDNVQILEHKMGYSKFIYKNHEYELNVEGEYNIQNSLAAIEMGLALGMRGDEISAGLKKYLPIEKRWEVEEIKGFKIINDSYNANPDSVKAAVSAFIELYQGDRLVVLGDMGELGDMEVEYHQQVGEFLAQKINKDIKVLTVGKLSAEITKKLDVQGVFSKNFENNLQIARYIIDNVKIGTTIILKASRSMKFEQIIQELQKT